MAFGKSVSRFFDTLRETNDFKVPNEFGMELRKLSSRLMYLRAEQVSSRGGMAYIRLRGASRVELCDGN